MKSQKQVTIKNILRPALCLAIFFMVLWSAGLASAEIDPYFKPLTDRLVDSGFDRAWVNDLFNQPCAKLYPVVLRIRLSVSESKINYAQYYQATPIKNGKAFMKKHQKTLDAAYAEYAVPPEIITSVLSLETNLGTYKARFQTLRTLATHCVAHDKKVADIVYNSLGPKTKSHWTKEKAAEKINNRADWFYGELRAFLRYLQASGKKPCEVYGSYTGALGLCQFQPTNIVPFGRDGNGDGIVDLTHFEDAIMSVGAYLNGYGWRKDLDYEGQVTVIKTYNNSRPYAETILEVAKRLGK